MKAFPLLLFLFCITLRSSAQDVHFSQFFLTPMLTSPANTGNFNGDWRFSANYRTQWKQIGAPYLTQAAGIEKQFYLHTEQISAGLQVVNDQSATTLKVLKVFGSVGYHKRLDKHTFHLGLQGGFVSKSFNRDIETYPNQFNWNTGQFDTGLPNQEGGVGENLSYADFNAGAGYEIKLGKLRPFLNLGFFHLTTPRESFSNTRNILKVRTVYHGGAFWDISQKVMLEPSFFLMATHKATDLLAGTNVHYLLQSDAISKTSLYAGAFYRDGFSRNWDAVFLTAGISFKNYTVGFSYDYNVSALQAATDNKGAFEVAFIYKARNTRLKKTLVPCDRY